MDWDKIRLFYEVVSAGNFTRAGEKLGVNQSSISRQISALEHDLKIPLFHRDGFKELLFDSLDSDVQLLSDLFISGKKPELREFGGMMAPVREKRADGKVLTTVYLAREGDIEVFD